MTNAMRILPVATAVVLSSPAAFAQQSAETLTGRNLLTMTGTGLPESTISSVGASASDFDLAAHGLVALADAGVEEIVLTELAEEEAGGGHPGPGRRQATGSQNAQQPHGAASPTGAGNTGPQIIRSTYLPGDTFSDALTSGGTGPEMVVIPAGSFQMGCVSGVQCGDHEIPVHEVTISHSSRYRSTRSRSRTTTASRCRLDVSTTKAGAVTAGR